MIGKRETVVQGVSAVLGQWSRPALVTALSLSQYLCLSCVGPSAPVTGTQHVTINLDSATPVNTQHQAYSARENSMERVDECCSW